MKRATDIAVAGSGLVVLSPLLAGIAVAVAAKMGRPILFVQERPGRHGRIFKLMKFRTMADPDPGKDLVSDEQRLTNFGRLLRSTSLDELPTLINVLKGDMSLVGPRPLLIRYLGRYSPVQARRHEVRPGITGLAQIHGRNALSWEEKFTFDVEYVDNRSPLLDCRILWRTLVVVFRKDGISAAQHVTMPEFRGLTDDPEVTK
ncbi:sugar transferase [Pseudarthrobacter sp. C1]|uniref:sugar transferase n=1 Tax=Pseudarthrobacter sp. C1 TaxID=3108940 RepID=UPI002B05743C|nr:sugar transferase [Pseudarthrobacter sp. C1]MEA3550224.1 sugar transferase [Pseudarthrobacter sp. C1]